MRNDCGTRRPVYSRLRSLRAHRRPPYVSSLQIIHHGDHWDYVVNGRLIHHIETLDGEPIYEDHGSIRLLDKDCVTFIESLEVLSENANQAIESYCDLCDKEMALKKQL